MNVRLVWVGGMLGAAVIAAGCGGSDEGVFETGAGTTATSAATATSVGATTGAGGSTGSAGATTGTGGSSSATGTGGAGGATATGAGGATGVGGGGGAGGGCVSTAWYCDADVDGHGDVNATVMACVAPPGVDNTCFGPYIAASDDCAPNDERAYPGETDYYGKPATPPLYAVPAYDFDCDGTETKDPAQLFKGTGVLACGAGDCFGINVPEGFGPNAVCGSLDQYFRCEQPIAQACTPHAVAAPEALRCR